MFFLDGKKIIILLLIVSLMLLPQGNKASDTGVTAVTAVGSGITVTLNPGEVSSVNPVNEFETNNQTHWRVDLNPYGTYDTIYLKEVYLYFIDKNGNEHRGSISQYFYKGIKMSLPDALSFPLSISVCNPQTSRDFVLGFCPDGTGDSATVFVTPPNVPLDTISQVGLFLQVTTLSGANGVRIKAKSKGEIFKAPILSRKLGSSFLYDSIYEGLSYLIGFWYFPTLLNNTESPILRKIIFINPNLPLTPTETTLSGPTSAPTSTEPIIEVPAETPQVDPFAKDQILKAIDNLLVTTNDFSKTKYYNKFISYTRRLQDTLQVAKDNVESGGNICSQQINTIIKALDSVIYYIEKRICISRTSTGQTICRSASSFLSALKESKNTINSTLEIDNNQDNVADACQVE